MLKFFRYFLIFSLIIFSTNKTAALELEDIQVHCTPSVSFNNSDSYPSNIGKTNNLRRKPGAASLAEGTPILIKGRVVGENCLPISGTKVEIWHADSNGKDEDENFGGSGTIFTNNVGEYYFLTVFPGSEGERKAPHINFKVSHPDLGELFTKIYFPERPRNLVDEEIQALDEGIRDSATASKQVIGGEEIYTLNITLKGLSKHERY